jgi:hypothetical protein
VNKGRRRFGWISSRHDSERNVGKGIGNGRGRLPPSKIGKKAIAGAGAMGETQQKRGRGKGARSTLEAGVRLAVTGANPCSQ